MAQIPKMGKSAGDGHIKDDDEKFKVGIQGSIWERGMSEGRY